MAVVDDRTVFPGPLIDDVVCNDVVVGGRVNVNGLPIGPDTEIMGDDVVRDLNEPCVRQEINAGAPRGVRINISAVKNDIAGYSRCRGEHSCLGATDLEPYRIVNKQIADDCSARPKLCPGG